MLYQDDFDQLYEQHQAANNYGELLTISIAKDKVDDIVYPARAGGYLLPEKGKALQAIQACNANIADINNVYLQSSGEQGPIFCAAALNIPGEGKEVCKIRSVNLADPEKYKEYENQRQALFEKIKNSSSSN